MSLAGLKSTPMPQLETVSTVSGNMKPDTRRRAVLMNTTIERTLKTMTDRSDCELSEDEDALDISHNVGRDLLTSFELCVFRCFLRVEPRFVCAMTSCISSFPVRTSLFSLCMLYPHKSWIKTLERIVKSCSAPRHPNWPSLGPNSSKAPSLLRHGFIGPAEGFDRIQGQM